MTLVLLALAWLVAAAAVALWQAPWWMAGLWCLVASPAAFAWRGKSAGLLVLGMAAIAAAGGWRFADWTDRPAPALAAWTGRDVTVEGRIASEPDPGETTVRYRVDARTVARRGGMAQATSGRVLVTLDQYAEYEPGATVRVTGTLDEPEDFDAFDYRGYLARQGVVGTMYRPRVEVLREAGRWDRQRMAGDVRGRLERSLQRALPEPEASLGAGITFGRDGYLPRELYDDFRTTGLAHLVAVSGSNVTMVTALTFIVLGRFVRRTWAIWPAMVAALLYVLVAGASESVVRAGIMAWIALFGMFIGRPQSGLAALGAAAVLMTAVSPAAFQDVGFQLSLAATAGIIACTPWLTWALEEGLARVHADRFVPDLVPRAAGLMLGATLATLPLSWAHFGQVSLIGVVLNVLAEPLFAAAFWLSALAAVAGLAWGPAGWAAGLAAYYPLAALTWLGRHGAEVPGAAAALPALGPPGAFAALALLTLPGWFAYRYLAPVRPPAVRGMPATARRFTLGAGVALLAVAAWRVSLAPIGGPGELRVDVLDVGQGDAILVTTPAGHTTLVDSGPSSIQLARQLGAVLPHWQRRVDRTILTHPEEDHMAGFVGLARRYRVGVMADTGTAATSGTFLLYRARPVERPQLQQGDRWEQDGVLFEVLWPPAGLVAREVNDTSAVLRVTYGDVSILLTGDSEAPVHEALLAAGEAHATVLKVPHHGSRSSSMAFLRGTGAAVSVISVGEGNRYGHPAPETLTALAGTTVFRTDQDGRVTIHSDGRTVRVTTSPR